VEQAVLGSLPRGHERHLVPRAPSGLAAATPATEVGVVDLDLAGEPPAGLCQPHALQGIVLEQPGSALAHAQVPPWLQGRDVRIGLGQQLHRQEPARQRQLAGLEDRAAEDAALVLAASALPVAPALPLEAPSGLASVWKELGVAFLLGTLQLALVDRREGQEPGSQGQPGSVGRRAARQESLLD
jgi:hypothetical protein